MGVIVCSGSELSLNLIIYLKVHTMPLRSLIQVLEWESPRKSAAVCAKGRCSAGLIPALVIFSGLFFPSASEPVRILRHHNLEPGAFAWSAVLSDSDTGDGKNLP